MKTRFELHTHICAANRDPSQVRGLRLVIVHPATALLERLMEEAQLTGTGGFLSYGCCQSGHYNAQFSPTTPAPLLPSRQICQGNSHWVKLTQTVSSQLKIIFTIHCNTVQSKPKYSLSSILDSDQGSRGEPSSPTYLFLELIQVKWKCN